MIFIGILYLFIVSITCWGVWVVIWTLFGDIIVHKMNIYDHRKEWKRP